MATRYESKKKSSEFFFERMNLRKIFASLAKMEQIVFLDTFSVKLIFCMLLKASIKVIEAS